MTECPVAYQIFGTTGDSGRLAAVGSADEWLHAVASIRADGGPRRSVHVRGLYELAIRDGRLILRSFRMQLGADRLDDLIHDLLTEKLDTIIGADAPKVFFATALVRRAISWQRRGDAEVLEAPTDDKAIPVRAEYSVEDERTAFVLDAGAALARLSSRDRDIVVAAALGASREEIAVVHGTSRANVDQIISRVQRRFRGPQ